MSFKKPLRAVPLGNAELYRKRRKRQHRIKLARYFGAWGLAGILLAAGGTWLNEGGARSFFGGSDTEVFQDDSASRRADDATYFPNCAAARAAGAASLRSSDPGYRTELDRDGDGRACEPYRGY